MRPNLCATPTHDQLRQYLEEDGYGYASFKLDGVRAMEQDGVLVSRTLKPIRNRWLQEAMQVYDISGLDGELIVGPPNAGDVYRKTMSQVMSYDGQPDFTFYVFDRRDLGAMPFEQRLGRLGDSRGRIKVLEQVRVTNLHQLGEFEARAIELGFEGVIYCRPHVPYKEGRSTAREGGKCKLKRFVDSEMQVTAVEELMLNQNEAVINELGYKSRGLSKAGMIPGDTMGKLIGVDIHTGIEVKLGTGFTSAERRQIWQNADREIGRIWKYKHFPVGVKDKARHPVALGRRHKDDLL